MRDSMVRATCPTCGDLVLTVGDLGLQLDDRQARVLFACPRCHQRVSRDVPTGMLDILRVAGVHLVEPEPELISAQELAEFLADFDQVGALDHLRRLGA